MRYNLLPPIVALALLATCGVAHAQQRVNSYTPARPTLSPYLYLTRQQSGPFPNYQTFVQPAQQQQQINRTQATNISNLSQTQQSQQLQIDQTQQQQQQQNQQQQQPQGMKILPSNVAPTGVGGSYNNLSHYYAGLNASGSGGGISPGASGGGGGGGGSARGRTASASGSGHQGGH